MCMGLRVMPKSGSKRKCRDPLPIKKLVLDNVETLVSYPVQLEKPDWIGSYDSSSGTICVQKTLTSQAALAVLIHEVFHYLWRRGRLNLFLCPLGVSERSLVDLEEACVSTLADELFEFLKLNKDNLKPLGRVWNDVFKGLDPLQRTMRGLKVVPHPSGGYELAKSYPISAMNSSTIPPNFIQAVRR